MANDCILLPRYEGFCARGHAEPYTRCADEIVSCPVAEQVFGARRPQIRKDTCNDVLAHIREREEAAISAVVQESEHTHTATTGVGNSIYNRRSQLNH